MRCLLVRRSPLTIVNVERFANEGRDNPPSVQEESEEHVPARNTREEAMSMKHLLTHKPFNIHCDACNLGIMRKPQKFLGSYQESRQPTGWLDLVIADHLVAKNGGMVGITGPRRPCGQGPFFRRSRSSFRFATRLLSKLSGRLGISLAIMPLTVFIPTTPLSLSLVHEKSRAGVPQKNYVIERTNLDILEGTRTTYIDLCGIPRVLLAIRCARFLLP